MAGKKQIWRVTMCLAFLVALVGCLALWRVSRHTAHRFEHKNKLKQLMSALHEYHNLHQHVPPARDLDGFGWRLNIHPFLIRDGDLVHYRFTESWDSKYNLALDYLGEVYQCRFCARRRNVKDPFCTHFVAVTGAGTAFPTDGTAVGFADFKDSKADTILLVEIAQRDIHWSEPRDLTVDEAVRGDRFFQRPNGKAYFGMADGRVLSLDVKQPREAYLIADGDPMPLRLNGAPTRGNVQNRE